MIERHAQLPVTRQVKLLGLARSSVYYQPRPVPAEDLEPMRRIDHLHLDYPFAGSRMLRALLRTDGVVIGRRHVRTPLRRRGLHALYRQPRTSVPAAGRQVYPYLLQGLTIDHANQKCGRPTSVCRSKRRER